MRPSIQIVLAALIFIVSGVAWFVFQPASDQSRAGKGPSRPAPTVNVVEPRVGMVRDTLEAVGTTAASDSVNVVAQLSGRVAELNFQEGQRVEQGAVLVRLDETQAQAEYEVAKAEQRDARNKYERALRLSKTSNIATSEVEALETVLDAANARVDFARSELRDHTIVAPFTGVIGLRDISVGAYLQPGEVITTLDAIDQIELLFSVPERFLGQLHPQQHLVARSDAFPDQAFSGQVAQIGTRVDPVSRSVAVKSVIDNRDRRLRPGQFMTVELVLRERPNAVIIPEQAILTTGDRQFAFILRDGHAQRVQVKLGKRLPGEVEIAEGVAAADAVVVTGLARLRDGDKVQVLEDPAAVFGALVPAGTPTPE